VLNGACQVQITLQVVPEHCSCSDLLPVENGVEAGAVLHVDGDNRHLPQLGNTGHQGGQLDLTLQRNNSRPTFLLHVTGEDPANQLVDLLHVSLGVELEAVVGLGHGADGPVGLGHVVGALGVVEAGQTRQLVAGHSVHHEHVTFLLAWNEESPDLLCCRLVVVQVYVLECTRF